MKKKPTLSSLKKRAWKVFSEYIRKRDADNYGYCRCISCGKRAFWKEMQAGHLIAGRTNSILFDERGVYAQCVSDNLFGGGRPLEYLKALEGSLGRQEALELRDELLWLKNKPLSFTVQILEDMIIEYKDKIKQLNIEKGLS